MSLFKEYARNFVKTTSASVLTEKKKDVYNEDQVQTIAEELLKLMGAEDIANVEMETSSEGDTVSILAKFVDNQGNPINIFDINPKGEAAFKYFIKDLNGKRSEFNRKKGIWKGKPEYLLYQYDNIGDVGKEWNWRNDSTFCKYAAYNIIVEMIRNGLIKGNENNPGEIAQISVYLAKNEPDLGVLSTEEAEYFVNNKDYIDTKMDSDNYVELKGTFYGDKIPSLKRPEVDEVYRQLYNTIARNSDRWVPKEFNGEDSNYVYLDEQLPNDWSEEEKTNWVETRISKYIASFVAVYPWRVLLKKSDNQEEIKYLNDGSANNGGWFWFRTEEAAANALNKVANKWKGDYLKYSEITHMNDFISPELVRLLVSVNEKPEQVGLRSKLSLTNFIKNYKNIPNDEAYKNRDLSVRLNTIVAPYIRNLAMEVRQYYIDNPEDLVKEIETRQKGADND